MRILQVLHDFLPLHVAGVEIYTDQISRALAEKHEVALLFSEVNHSEENYTLRRRSHQGLTAYEIINNQRYKNFEESYENSEIARSVELVLDEFRPDVVHVQHLLNLSIDVVRQAKNRRIPVVMTLNDHWLACANGGQRFQREAGRCERLDSGRCGPCTAHMHGIVLGARGLLNRMVSGQDASAAELPLASIEPESIQTPDSRFVYRDHYEHQGALRPTWVAHPPSVIRFALSIASGVELQGSVALHPSTFDQIGGGVRFSARVNGSVEFDAALDPKSRPQDRRPLELRIPLRSGPCSIELTTEATGDNSYCTAGWVGLRLQSTTGSGSLRGARAPETLRRAGRSLARVMSRNAQIQRIERRWRAMRMLGSQVDLFISPSRYLAEEFVRFGLPESRMRVCDYGFQTGAFERRSDLPDFARNFGFIGSPVPHKGLHVLFDAFEGMPDDARLDVYGSLYYDPPYAESLKNRARHPGIRLHGSVANHDVPSLLASVDVLVVPSIWQENSPLTIHEAFLAGVPIVASRLGGHIDLLTQGGGLLYDADDSDALRATLLRLYREAGLARKIAEAAPAVKSISQHRAELESIYHQLLAASGRG